MRVSDTAMAQIEGTKLDMFFEEGEHVILVHAIQNPKFPWQKFVYDGTEEENEIAQAFFHFVYHMSGGREVVWDLQGSSYNGVIELIDPVHMKVRGAKEKIEALDFNVAPLCGLVPTDSGAHKIVRRLHHRCTDTCRAVGCPEITLASKAQWIGAPWCGF